MKKARILVIAAAVFGLVAGVMAQAAGPQGGAPAQNGAAQTGPAIKLTPAHRLKLHDQVLAKLTLTPDRASKCKAHDEANIAKLADLRKTLKTATPDQRKEALKEFTKENREFMKETLGKDLFKEYTRLEQEQQKGLRDGTIKPPL